MTVERATAALALSTVALVPSIYGAALPAMSEVRGQADDRGHLAAAEQYAALVAGATVLGISAVTGSPEVAVVGVVAVVAFASAYRVARRAEP